MAQLPVLVCEENEAEKFVLKKLLACFDYKAVVVSSTTDAINELNSTKYAAVFLNLSVAGPELVKKVRGGELEHNTRIPIIALNESGDHCEFDDDPEKGIQACLHKPFKAEELRRLLLRFVYNPERPNLKTLRALEGDNVDHYQEFKLDGTNF